MAMFDRIAQFVLIALGILLFFLLILLLSVSCRTRTPSGSVTPVVVTTDRFMTATPMAETTIHNQPTPTPFMGNNRATATATPTTGNNPATETPISVDATANPSEPPPALEVTATSVPIEDGVTVPSSFVPGSTVPHQVRRGEWLLQIARCYGTSYEAVYAANRMPYPDFILPGTIINVPAIGSNGRIIGPPCVVPYTVQAGDTWEALANRFASTAAILQKANPSGLRVGNEIWVPRNN
jgi:LysM repeat protein